MDARERGGGQRTELQREMIVARLKERGCRITRQRLKLIDIILENACTILLDDGTVHHLSAKNWNSVIREGLASCGYLTDQKILSVSVRPCNCEKPECE